MKTTTTTTTNRKAARAAAGKRPRAGIRIAPAPSTTHEVHGKNGITQQQVQELAYLLYVREGRPEGRHLQHWLEAESRLNGQVKRDE
jgi:hypothetical protein